MSRSQIVAEHLPLLRRYSRALTGSQSSGDAYVAAMLEALLQDGSILDESKGSRAGLFKLFTKIWNSVSLNENSDVIPFHVPPEKRLANITPLPRQAFLLLSLEGFAEEEVAFILDRSVGEVRALAEEAGRELAAGDLAVVEAGTRHTPLEVVAGESGARVVVLGGPPFEEEVVMWWNFVGRSHDEVVAAQEEWNAHGGRFGYVAGYVPRSDEHWWIPAPDLPGVRLRPRGRLGWAVT